MPMNNGPYTAGRFALELDGNKQVGWLTGIDGGHFKSSAVDHMQGGTNLVSRYAGRPSYDDITINCGLALSNEFWGWIQSSLNYKPQRRNGAIVAYDFDSKERARRTFKDALISEIGFPALDGSTKTAASFSIKLSPETITWEQGQGASMASPNANNEPAKQKRFQSCNFEVVIDRFKSDARLRKCKVEAFAVKQNIIADPIGGSLVARKQAGRLEMPQIVITFPETLSKIWYDWHQAAVVAGSRNDQFSTGHIAYLDQDLKTELMRVELKGLSLLSLEYEKLEAHKEGINTCKATLNVEGLELIKGAGTV